MTRGEVLYAKRIVRDMHPLYRLDLELVLPFFSPLISVWKGIFGGQHTVMDEEREKLDKDVVKSDAKNADEDTLSEGEFDFFLEEGEDPIGRLGYGIVSYFSLIRIFVFVFGFLSVVYMPVIYDLSQWNAFEGEAQVSGNIAYTVGNMGMSMTRCMSFKMMTDKVSVGCHTGIIGNFTSFGVYAHGSQADEYNSCNADAGFDSGQPGCKGYSSRESSLFEDKLKPCQGKKSCVFKGLDDVIPQGTSYPDGEECKIAPTTTLFIQYSCIVQPDEIELKRFQCLKACCISMFSTLFLFAILNYLEKNIIIEKSEWDLQTVTASDYTVELKIRPEQVDEMKKQITQRNYRPDLPMGARMKFILIDEIQRLMKEISGEDGYTVADVNFAYQNSWLIDKLKERGTAIKWQDWAKLNEINQGITRELHERMEETITPVSAFVTIESETAYNYVCGVPSLKLFGTDSNVHEAVEPTNIIWENRDFSKLLRAAKAFMILVAVVVVLFITFVATFKAKDMQNTLVGKYSTDIKCSELKDMYSDSQIQTMAADEWYAYYKNGGMENDRNIASSLSCFCTDLYEDEGADAQEMLFSTSDKKMVATCSEIFDDKATVALIASGVSMLIVAVNFILKVMLIEMVSGLRLKTMTKETDITMVAIFVGQFVNTAILLVLNNASFKDFDEGYGPLSAIFFVGTETDFSVNWYRQVGALIISTLIVQALWPLIEIAMFGAMWWGKQYMDRDFGSDSYKTKMPTAQAYVDLYAGPVYLIHYRYSMILLHIGCAFMYGTCMPILYIVAFVAFIVLFINERVLVCYYYREPPSFDEEITMKAMNIIQWIPITALPIIFWQMGNRQIFETEVVPIDRASDVIMSNHDLKNALSHTNPLYMTYNTGPFFLFTVIITYYVLRWLKNVILDDEEEDDQLCEGLSDYYDALEQTDKAVNIGSEKHYLERYRTRTFEEKQFERLQKSGTAELEKIIMGCGTYRPLDNLKYQQEFQYEPVKLENGTTRRDNAIFVSTQEIEGAEQRNDLAQADIPWLAMNIAFVPHDKRATLNFCTKAGNPIFTK